MSDYGKKEILVFCKNKNCLNGNGMFDLCRCSEYEQIKSKLSETESIKEKVTCPLCKTQFIVEFKPYTQWMTYTW